MSELNGFSSSLFCEIHDPKFGLLGYLAIDRTINGRACGGIRWGPEVSKEEVQALAHDMSLKYGFANIGLGGAKAGIVAPFELSQEERKARLLAFGRHLGPLLRSKIYIPGADLGTNHEDMLTVLEGAGIFRQNRIHGEQTGYYTGYGVVQAAVVALRHLGSPVKDCRVAIEGFGKVGSTMGQLFAALGARVVAISTKHGGLYDPKGLEVGRLLSLRDPGDSAWIDRYVDADRIPPATLYTLPVDLLIPCAGAWMINESNVEQIRAKAIVPGANIPATRPIQERLEARGVLYLPDFMCNCGGVLANTLEWRGFSRSEIERFFHEEFTPKIEKVLSQVRTTGKTPAVLAETLALQNLDRMESAIERAKTRSRSAKLFKALAKPRRVLQLLASNYYRGQRSLRRLVAPLAWAEAKQVFHADQ